MSKKKDYSGSDLTNPADDTAFKQNKQTTYPVPAADHTPANATGETVWVGCRKQTGFVFSVGGVDVHINGSNTTLLRIKGGALRNEYAYTEVKKDLWDEVVKKYKHLNALKNGILFSGKSLAELRVEAEKNLYNITSGIDAIDVENRTDDK